MVVQQRRAVEFSGSEPVDIGSCKCKRSIGCCMQLCEESSADERSLGADDVCVGDIYHV